MDKLSHKSKKYYRRVASKFNLKKHRANYGHRNVYKQNNPSARTIVASEHLTAVVIHLYYTESWQVIKSKLKNLPENSFDLFVSMPQARMEFEQTIRADYPDAFIYHAPNRGRDVLPFLYILKHLRTAGYSSVLKLHSKKSTHRTDGGDWFEGMLQSLLPSSKEALNGLVRVLKDPQTGIIGPAGQYLSLSVNFEANGTHMTHLLDEMYSKGTSQRVLQTHRNEYGFFAGTMFWARLDALDHILDAQPRLSQFELEQGQIDATLAHALERVFCLVAEIDDKKMYEISSKRIRPIDYNAGTIPDWSGVYIGQKS